MSEDSINTLIGTFSALTASSLTEQTMEQCICIDTSTNRIGINTLGPSYAIDISNVGTSVKESIRTPRLLVTDKIGINTLDPSYAIDISNLGTGVIEGIRTPRLLVTDKIGINTLDPSYAIDISNLSISEKSYIRTPRLIISDISRLTFNTINSSNILSLISGEIYVDASNYLRLR
jgi:hypothetical protein